MPTNIWNEPIFFLPIAVPCGNELYSMYVVRFQLGFVNILLQAERRIEATHSPWAAIQVYILYI